MYPTLTNQMTQMTMMLGGQYKLSEVQAQHWNKPSESMGLNHTAHA